MNKIKKILIVVGTRPNFIKVTRFRELAGNFPNLEVRFVHTGQHFDKQMAEVFFEQFGLRPDYFLPTPAGSPVTQMAEIMKGLESTVTEMKPDLLMVVGDVNSTLAASIVASKMGVKCAHLESGLRSFDRTMPEEINRLLTDEIADLFFVTEQSGIDHLIKEGKPKEKIHFVGNTMIDSLVFFKEQIHAQNILSDLNLEKNKYVLMTMHRPSNVDSAEGLETLIRICSGITERLKLVFPIHPRTIQNIRKFGLWEKFQAIKNVILVEPLDYFSFQKLTADAAFIVTDSGGIQEETTFLGIPCLTLRENTERPVTCDIGTNTLVEYTESALMQQVDAIMNGTYKKGVVPLLWDGNATQRILEILDRLSLN